MSPALSTQPPVVNIAKVDTPTLSCDMAPILLAGETVVSAVTKLVVIGGQSARFSKLPSLPVVVGDVVTQQISGQDLEVGTSYRLTWTLTLSSGDVISQQTNIVLPF